jgi:hypothetical protein
MTTERALDQLANLLGGFDSDTEEQITEILEQLYTDAHEEGFDLGIQEGADLYALDFEEGKYGEDDY